MSDLLYLKRHSISPRYSQNKSKNIQPLKPYILISLSLCRPTDTQTTKYFSFGEFALTVRSCYRCSLIQFCLTGASNHWLPCAFHQPAKVIINIIQLFSPSDIAEYEKKTLLQGMDCTCGSSPECIQSYIAKMLSMSDQYSHLPTKKSHQLAVKLKMSAEEFISFS